jgi:hypothetical protein
MKRRAAQLRVARPRVRQGRVLLWFAAEMYTGVERICIALTARAVADRAGGRAGYAPDGLCVAAG